MTHAYSESYLSNAKDRLSSFFDYAINDCKLNPDWVTALFLNTGYAEQFERGNPAFVAGMSGVELARAVILKAYGRKVLPEPTHAVDCSPEYWAGWAVAEYQWFSGRRFKDIFERIPLSKIIGMYSVYRLKLSSNLPVPLLPRFLLHWQAGKHPHSNSRFHFLQPAQSEFVYSCENLLTSSFQSPRILPWEALP